MPDFQATYAAVAKAQERVDTVETELALAKASLSGAFIAHAQHFRVQSRLAGKMNIKAPYLNDLLKGKRYISKATVTKLLGANLDV